MTVIDLHLLVKSFDSRLASSLERAAGLAVSYAHVMVELEHWARAWLENGELTALLTNAGVDVAALRSESEAALGEMPRTAEGPPTLSQPLIGLAREAWCAASLRFGHARIAPEVLFLTLGGDTDFRARLRGNMPSLLRLRLGALEERATTAAASTAPNTPDEGSSVAPPPSGEDFLSKFATDLTEEARAGRIDPVIGRDHELRQVVDVLISRRQNNPILVGEAGVGKTAIVEAFALAVVEGSLPKALHGVRVMALDLSLLQAGASVKGEFERRLKGLVDQVRRSPEPIILFVDEAHTMIGAGNQAGGGDAANILKPALARGELRTIAATTWREYKKHIEKDPALTRRFQTVKVAEPDIETAVRMLRHLAPKFAGHHGVRIRDAALRAAVELSARYIADSQLPDKAVSVLDTACASIAISRQSAPAALADVTREVEVIEAEISALGSEPATPDTPTRLRELRADLASARSETAALETRLAAERELVEVADTVETELGGESDAEARRRLTMAERKLKRLQGESPLVHRVVDGATVAAVIGRMTGIPQGRLQRGHADAVATLEERLAARVIGQAPAIARLSEAMRTAATGLGDPRRPAGVFLMVGTSGVGKTETALALSDALYGGAQGLTIINMSEFKEEHKVATLMGSPPGYIGYGEGGVLTEAVRRRPYGAVLLDEIDKAHPGVQDVFYQLFDKGSLRDGEGVDVDFRNTTILLTANTGTETLSKLMQDPETMPEGTALVDALMPELLGTFRPAFLGRVTVLPFLPLDAETLARILDLQIARIAERISDTYGARLDVAQGAYAALLDNAAAGHTGARAIEAMLSREVLPRLAEFFLPVLGGGRMPRAVLLDRDETGRFAVSAVGPRQRKAN
ncbi:MAG: type VI secretion system ATPase TssH [Pseudomonadota bacterium]